MSDLVYLSTGKLRQLNIGRRRGFLGKVNATVNLLSIGSVSGEIGTQRNVARELERAVERLETVWFTEQVRAYQWVEFEALMSYTIIGSAVVFLDVAGSTGGCPSGGESRLLLHGSSGNLVDEGPHASVTVEELSELAAARSVYHPEVLASVINHFVDLIEYRSNEGSDQTDTGPAIHGSWFNNHIGGQACTTSFLRWLIGCGCRTQQDGRAVTHASPASLRPRPSIIHAVRVTAVCPVGPTGIENT